MSENIQPPYIPGQPTLPNYAPFADPPKPEPAKVQWYAIEEENGQPALKNFWGRVDGEGCANVFGWRTNIPDKQLGLIKTLPGAEAFSILGHIDHPTETFFVGGEFTRFQN